jgi:DNA primase
MRFSESYLRVLKERASIAAYAGSKLAFDKRKSNPGRGDYWACCPFHGEKSPSFHVVEDKGTYKCFGCGEAGGTLDLVMKLEGLSFPEAVERLAEFAGVPLPEEPQSKALDAETRLRQRAMAAATAAQALFRETLLGPQGSEPRAYLQGRGLGPAEWERFGIGFAPDGWTTCLEALGRQGFTLDELTAAGLARPPQDGKRAISIFRNRVTFRIDDAQGRLIAFGARALEKEAQAKYINSPDCLIFHKGRTLYRLKSARETLARTKGQGLVVAEGYLDAIAFERAGVPAVAPLGTALTEDQLALLWKAGPEPIFCFDGDGAGSRAASRVLEMALPQLGPERTLWVVSLPGGEDPDDLFARAGADALTESLKAAVPAVEALFNREAAAKPLQTPEAKAGLKARLKKAAFAIQDEETKKLYLKELLDRADALLRPAPRPRPQPPQRPPPRASAPRRTGKAAANAPSWFNGPPPGPSPELKQGLGKPMLADYERLLGGAIDYPDLCLDHAEVLANLAIPDPHLVTIRDTLLESVATGSPLDRNTLQTKLVSVGMVDAATKVTHLPPLSSERSETVKDNEAEAVRVALLAEARQSPADMKAPGATRERVAKRASARQSLTANAARDIVVARPLFARLVHELYERAIRAREEEALKASPAADDELAFARAQALHFDRLRAARAQADHTDTGAE